PPGARPRRRRSRPSRWRRRPRRPSRGRGQGGVGRAWRRGSELAALHFAEDLLGLGPLHGLGAPAGGFEGGIEALGGLLGLRGLGRRLLHERLELGILHGPIRGSRADDRGARERVPVGPWWDRMVILPVRAQVVK
ncbi:MAG: hypothetical protein ACK56I_27105, partial [bacterium]